MKHLTSLLNLSVDDVHAILTKSHELKAGWKRGERPALLQGRYLTQVFEKPSLRTRVSFDAAMAQLGGTGNFLSGNDVGLSTGRESLADIARVLSGYSDAVVLRTFSQTLIEDFASFSRCPVINGLSDDDHPCQALTDILTLQEMWGDVKGKRLVFVGDGNNVAASLAMITSMLGMSMTVCAPRDFELEESLLQAIRLEYPSADIMQTVDLNLAMA
ncbi:MAG: ornithine carbamoyltransferase, partial [Planctomycetaceae bacterium]|nr:ornithine carbamoyltransferase [Planctomycetaceae bacterium]